MRPKSSVSSRPALVGSDQRRPNLVPVAHAFGRDAVIDGDVLSVVGFLVEAAGDDLGCTVIEIETTRRPARS